MQLKSVAPRGAPSDRFNHRFALQRGRLTGCYVPRIMITAVMIVLIWPVAHAQNPSIELVPADPDSGFNFPYVLRSPKSADNRGKIILLVETNNSGNNDDFNQQIEAAIHFTGHKGIGPVAAGKLDVPLLVPIFPRTESEPHIYTHALDRDTLTSTEQNLRRIDVQLMNMIEDARRVLKERGIETRERVVLCGFSASGTFANRIAFLHPEKVLAVVSGGINAFPMLPISEYGGHTLNYPLGVGDITNFVRDEFNLQVWREIPQLLFMGQEDENDAVEYDDAYSSNDRDLIYSVIGRGMGDRWRKAQKIYLESGSNATFVTYGRVGHWTDTRIANDISNFILYQTLGGT